MKREHPVDDRVADHPLTDLEEFRYWLSEAMRWQGTAFLYRWQYMMEDFPNPPQINFFEVFSEKGREGIDYRNRVISVKHSNT